MLLIWLCVFKSRYFWFLIDWIWKGDRWWIFYGISQFLIDITEFWCRYLIGRGSPITTIILYYGRNQDTLSWTTIWVRCFSFYLHNAKHTIWAAKNLDMCLAEVDTYAIASKWKLRSMMCDSNCCMLYFLRATK